uniref:Uncharacterized protein n=1 Tax=Vespula pensylvanica TaxID=30213 RepID=A0A834UBW0_VESPE|nr:hypothetical protein H0235_006089 [Vespula pensylvanica]
MFAKHGSINLIENGRLFPDTSRTCVSYESCSTYVLAWVVPLRKLSDLIVHGVRPGYSDSPPVASLSEEAAMAARKFSAEGNLRWRGFVWQKGDCRSIRIKDPCGARATQQQAAHFAPGTHPLPHRLIRFTP